MADTKISELSAATTPLAGSEAVPIVQDGATVKVAASGLGAVQVATVTLSTEQIAALETTPVTIIEAQGEGKLILPLSGMIVGDDGAPFDDSENSVMGIIDGAPEPPLDLLNPFGAPSMMCWNTLETVGPAPTSMANNPLQLSLQTGWGGERGGLGTVTVNNGGTGYAQGDAGTITGEFEGVLAAYEVDTVDAGAVTAVTITSPGYGFNSTDTALLTEATTGTGEGLTLDVDTLATPTLTAKVTVHYVVIDVS